MKISQRSLRPVRKACASGNGVREAPNRCLALPPTRCSLIGPVAGIRERYSDQRIRTMRTMIRFTLLLALLALAGCTNDGEEPRYPHSSRVMLVYMAGDNSLGRAMCGRISMP